MCHLKTINFNRIILCVRQPHEERVVAAFLQLHYQINKTSDAAFHSLHANTTHHMDHTD